MSKKILVVSSSPRRGGNSDLLCDEFVRGALESGNEAKKIFLADYHIGYCTGCGVCNTTHRCVQKDDMKEILDQLVQADVIVLATPVYFYTMCGQMKTFIDRIVPRYTELFDKEFYYIAAAADTEKKALEKTIESFRGFTLDCLERPVEKGIIYGTGAWEKGEIRETDAMRQAYKMGKEA